ncbi:probable pyridoxal 5'-phosphate synthase subunit PDX1.2 [Miscanthus floridulus]|uniref:probable pyridoxal 5'-phosphate synthase subunit PDX1.2 n=1 Tax=Miscanthus floridulus TaxID=154761 RepID=UPI00345A7EFF
MAGLVIDPAAINAKLDYILAQLSTINKRLNSHDERIARLEKFQEEKKVRAAATPTAATVAFSHPRLPVQALEGDMAIDAASQTSANANLVAASVGANAVQRYVPPHWRDRARTSSPSPTPTTHTLIHSSVVTAYDNNDAALLAPSLQPKAVGVDYVDKSKALHKVRKGAAMIRTKGKVGMGNVVEAVHHVRSVMGNIRALRDMDNDEVFAYAKRIAAPYNLIMQNP